VSTLHHIPEELNILRHLLLNKNLIIYRGKGLIKNKYMSGALSENHTKHINTLLRQNADILDFKLMVGISGPA
jgi:hypothetical protein